MGEIRQTLLMNVKVTARYISLKMNYVERVGNLSSLIQDLKKKAGNLGKEKTNPNDRSNQKNA